MAKYRHIAFQVRQLIKKQGFRPGDLLPSERELAGRFRVSLHTVHCANDLLCRDGLLQRRHGKGTFLAQPMRSRRGRTRHERLGLLYADAPTPVSSHSQTLTFAVQEAARKAGYELLIERIQTEDLMQGKLPEMVRRRSVDALLLYHGVQSHHLRLLEEQRMLFLVVGNCRLGSEVPQVRLNARRLVHEITRELIQAKRRPIWLDVDPTRFDRYPMGIEIYQGYEDALRQHADETYLPHLCPLRPDRVMAAANRLASLGLERAAVIATDWSAPLLPSALKFKSPEADKLLIVPFPVANFFGSMQAPNLVEWSLRIEAQEIADQAVRTLIPVIEERAERLHSSSLEIGCRLFPTEHGARMEATRAWENRDGFLVERYGDGLSLRHLGLPEQVRTPPGGGDSVLSRLAAEVAPFPVPSPHLNVPFTTTSKGKP